MRRITIIALLVAALAAGWTFAPRQVRTAAPPPDDPARGLVYAGLRQEVGAGPCRGNFQLDRPSSGSQRAVCSHGPDPAPAGVDIHRSQSPVAAGPAGSGDRAGSGVAASGSVRCDGDGSSGYRVQFVYAHASNVSDRYSQYATSFQQWAANVDNSFSQSAAETGGDRHLRIVTDASCNAVVDRVTLSTSGDDSFSNTMAELRSKGYTRTDRKYLIWMDANVYCGIAQVYYDDSPGQSNASNGNAGVPGEMGRVDSGCWGQSAPLEGHELMHTLGAVQTSAPHSTAKNHCYDEWDLMCYNDGSGKALVYPCPSPHQSLFDCNHDDYFSTAPPAGNYLATHWNTADSRFLIGAGSTSTTTAPPTTVGPTTTAVSSTTVAPSTTAPPVSTTAPPSGLVPSAPRALYAVQPSGAGTNGIVLSWTPPVSPNGTITGYRVYRGTTSANLVAVADVGPATSYADTATVPNALYYYQVTALNAAGESPRSALARMLAK